MRRNSNLLSCGKVFCWQQGSLLCYNESIPIHCPSGARFVALAGEAWLLSGKDDSRLVPAEEFGTTIQSDWDAILSERIDAFLRQWEEQNAPPDLCAFLPEGPVGVRQMAVSLLIMADQEQRCRRGCMQPPEWYVELLGSVLLNGQLSCDVILEDLHLRRHAGETVDSGAYLQRFPAQAQQLRDLLQLGGGSPTSSSKSSTAAETFSPGQEVDDFDLVNRLGQGAFATVYLARQRSMQRLVALKISRSRSDEPQTLAQLDHPHIVRVYDQRTLPEQQLHLLYMQFVPGGTLQDVVQRVRHIPDSHRSGIVLLSQVDQALEDRGLSKPSFSLSRQVLERSDWPGVVCWLGARLAEALEYAHHRGVLHRDIKPANVLLSEEGSPKLADFNISFSNEVEGASAREFFGGSLAYMSPEQLEAYHPEMVAQPEDLDGRSDLYSLGVMLWELATGDRPFHDPMLPSGMLATVAEMVERRRQGVAPEALERLPRDFPLGLRDVLLRCLDPDPAKRYANASQLARQLQLCLDPEVQALLRPPPASWRVRVARRPLTALVGVALIPNVILSLLNIAFNLRAIIASITSGMASEQAEYIRQIFLGVQLAVVNATVYTIGVGICVWMARITARAVSQREPPASDERWLTVSRNTLRLPWCIGLVVLTLWISSGFIFPMWIDLISGRGQISLGIYLQFVTSQVLCGLIAAAMSFFLVAYLVIQAFYPRLVPSEVTEADARPELEQLSRRVNGVFFVLVLVPFAAVIAASWFLWKRLTTPGQAETIIQDALLEALVFGVLAVLGAIAIMAALWLGRKIQMAIDALVLAVCPPKQMNEPTESAAPGLFSSNVLLSSSMLGITRMRSSRRI